MHFEKKKSPGPVPTIRWQDCVAKTTEDGKPGIGVHEHCCNVAQIAKALVDRLPAQVVELLGSNPVVVSALHDVGKVSPGFQKKYFPEHIRSLCPELAEHSLSSYPTRHARISEAALNRRLGARFDSAPLAVVVGAHHGKRDGDPPSDTDGTLGGSAWSNERAALVEQIIGDFGPLPGDEPLLDLETLAGLVCVADWIGSDESFFPPAGLPSGVDRPERAREAVSKCGFDIPVVTPGLSFQDIFPFPPNDMQRDVIDAIDGRGLYVLEAPMGLGKTEAALYAAYRLMEQGQNSGLYFGLPTRLTSDRIHERVRSFVARICGDDWGARLAHGHAWLRGFEHGGAALGAGGRWFAPSKRSLLYPFAVGTVDQALLAVLRVYHHFVRCFGLAGKVVVLDEVHSYDVYTGMLLDALVRRLLDLSCTVIVLSATLTRQRRGSFLSAASCTLESRDPYPLLTVEVGGRVFEKVSAPPPSKSVWLSISASSDAGVAQRAVEQAMQHRCVLCIANTVAKAQRWYDEVKAAMPEGAFEIGLLHSKFTAWRREALEEKWMQALSKDGPRSPGCVLVATQVVEQSVDIDADVMITELAPTDMLLQRMGRLWRHDRGERPCRRPEVMVVTGAVDDAGSRDDLVAALGQANCFVYDPYVLWRTFRVWNGRDAVRLPADIREVLEATYREPDEPLPAFVAELRARLEQRKAKLGTLATAARAGVTGLLTMDDDERAPTRYSDRPTTDALLVRGVSTRGSTATLVLCDGETVTVDRHQKDFRMTARLHRNLVAVPSYAIPPVKRPPWLDRHFHGDVAVLVIGALGDLTLDGAGTGLRYDDERGLAKAEKVVDRVELPGIETIPRSNPLDIDEWEGGLDGLDW
jgi:CRISPR-associated endonuclease/helicase Cas3